MSKNAGCGSIYARVILRGKEALDAGVAPGVVLSSTHQKALEIVTLAQLKAHAI